MEKSKGIGGLIVTGLLLVLACLVVTNLFLINNVGRLQETISRGRLGSAQGIVPTLSTTSAEIIGTTPVVAIASSTGCASRIISTTNKPVMITFDQTNGATPTGIFGILQNASTTVAYDSVLYGCGAVKMYGFDSASNVTVLEYR